jgi:hypothetical protein
MSYLRAANDLIVALPMVVISFTPVEHGQGFS